MRALDGDPEACRVEELDVVLAVSERDHAVEVEAEIAATKASPDPFVTLGFPISSMYGSDVVRNARPSSRRSSSGRISARTGGSATATSFVGGRSSHARRSPTATTGRRWKTEYRRVYSLSSAT